MYTSPKSIIKGDNWSSRSTIKIEVFTETLQSPGYPGCIGHGFHGLGHNVADMNVNNVEDDDNVGSR